MKWYEGSINEAVATSKSRKAIFVVFVQGKDDISTQVAQVINEKEVSSKLEQDDFVAIRLESDSEIYRYFVQIYRLVPVPSIFFIGENGTPLEIIAYNTTVPHLVAKIDAVLVKGKKDAKHSSDSLIEAEKKATTTDNATKPDNNISATSDNVPKADEIPTGSKPSEDTSIKDDVIKDNATEVDNNTSASNDNVPKADEIPKVEKPSEDTPIKNDTINDNAKSEASASTADIEKPKSNESSGSQENSTTNQLTLEDKVERARQLIDEQKRQKVIEEEMKQIEREVERRKAGHEMQKSLRKMQEIQAKQAQEERRRDMAADAAARKKVMEQIAQDKLERKQKSLALQDKLEKKQKDSALQEQPSEQSKPQVSTSVDGNITRIQFKLPEGLPHTGQFESTEKLHSVRSYIVDNIQLPFKQFTLSVLYPRKELGKEDDNKTLLELELFPTAVILILPQKNSTVTSVTAAQELGAVSRFIWYIASPLVGAYNYIVSYFFGGNRRDPRNQRDDSNEISDVQNTSKSGPTNVQNVPQFQGWFRRYLNSNQGGTTIRVEGNIHRLHSGGNDNDENNTWNGNSTQQM